MNNEKGRGVDSPPKHLDIFQAAPLKLQTPLSNQFPVRVCSCPLCIMNRQWRHLDGIYKSDGQYDTGTI